MRVRLGELLIASRRITEAQLEEALTTQQHFHDRLGTTLVELGYAQADDVARALSKQSGWPPALTKHFASIDPNAVALLLPRAAEEYFAVPMGFTSTTPQRLVIAFRDPNLKHVEEITFLLRQRHRVTAAIAPELEIVRCLEKYYGISRRLRFVKLDQEAKKTEVKRAPAPAKEGVTSLSAPPPPVAEAEPPAPQAPPSPPEEEDEGPRTLSGIGPNAPSRQALVPPPPAPSRPTVHGQGAPLGYGERSIAPEEPQKPPVPPPAVSRPRAIEYLSAPIFPVAKPIEPNEPPAPPPPPAPSSPIAIESERTTLLGPGPTPNAPAVSIPQAPPLVDRGLALERLLAAAEPIPATPQPVLAEAEPRLAAAEACLAEVEPCLAEAEPCLAEAQPRLAEAQPCLAEAEPRLAEAEPRLAEAEPVLAAAEPALPVPETVVAAPKLELAAPTAAIAAPEPVVAAPKPAATSGVAASLSARHAIAALQAASTKDEVADAILDALRTPCAAGLVLIRKDELALGWRGFATGVDQTAIESIALPLGVPSAFQKAFEARAPFRGAPPREGAALQTRLWKLLHVSAPSEVVVAPIVMKERVVNLVYAHPNEGSALPETLEADLAAVCDAAVKAYLRIIRGAKHET